MAESPTDIAFEAGISERAYDALAVGLRAEWEHSVLDRFVRAMPAAGEAPDYIHALTTAMIESRE